MQLDLTKIPFGDQIEDAARSIVQRSFDPKHVLDTAACDSVIGEVIKDSLITLPKKESPKENPGKFATMDAFIAIETLRKLHEVIEAELQADADYRASVKQDPDAPRNNDWRQSARGGDSGVDDDAISRSARDKTSDAVDRAIYNEAVKNDRLAEDAACKGREDNRREVRSDYDDDINEKLPPLPKFEGLPGPVAYKMAIRYYVEAVLKLSQGFPLHQKPRLRPLLDTDAVASIDLADLLDEIKDKASQLKYDDGGGRLQD